MSSINIRKLHVELYNTCKKIIIGSIAEAREFYTIRFMSLYLDLIKRKMSNQKFMALHVCFNTATSFNVGYNLTVCRFAPSTDEREESLSIILNDWVSCVLHEFGINVIRDVLTNTSDSGFDVKRTFNVLIDAWWEWCISHLAHLALTDAFGTSIDPDKSKNDEARQFFHRIKKTIEAVNKYEYLKQAFEEAMLEIFETYLKLLNLPQHRWSATSLVLKRILICWEASLQAYRKINRPMPLTDMDRTICIEFYSMIQPVRDLQVKA